MIRKPISFGLTILIFSLCACAALKQPADGELRQCMNIEPEIVKPSREEQRLLKLYLPEFYIRFTEEQRELSLANGDN